MDGGGAEDEVGSDEQGSREARNQPPAIAEQPEVSKPHQGSRVWSPWDMAS